jgi:ABC-type uncharacterized transport system auxiliary subunit
LDADRQRRRHADILAVKRASTVSALMLATMLAGCGPAPAAADPHAIDEAIARAEMELKAGKNRSALAQPSR